MQVSLLICNKPSLTSFVHCIQSKLLSSHGHHFFIHCKLDYEFNELFAFTLTHIKIHLCIDSVLQRLYEKEINKKVPLLLLSGSRAVRLALPTLVSVSMSYSTTEHKHIRIILLENAIQRVPKHNPAHLSSSSMTYAGERQ